MLPVVTTLAGTLAAPLRPQPANLATQSSEDRCSQPQLQTGRSAVGRPLSRLGSMAEHFFSLDRNHSKQSAHHLEASGLQPEAMLAGVTPAGAAPAAGGGCGNNENTHAASPLSRLVNLAFDSTKATAGCNASTQDAVTAGHPVFIGAAAAAGGSDTQSNVQQANDVSTANHAAVESAACSGWPEFWHKSGLAVLPLTGRLEIDAALPALSRVMQVGGCMQHSIC